MSEHQHLLSKSQITLLFVHLGRSTNSGQTADHCHPFWQLEIGLEGEIEFRAGNHRGTLTRDMQALMPPGTTHGFRYPNASARWVTYKFSLGGEKSMEPGGGDSPWLYHSHEHLAPIFLTLAGLAPAASLGARNETRLAVSLLQAVCAYAKEETNEERTSGEREQGGLRTRVDAVLRQSAGRAITVSEVADAVGLSAGHLSNQFSAENDATLKQHIDRVRFTFAKDLLEHADLPTSLIAHELQFPDVYSFSRFVKRMSGRSPREIRRTDGVGVN